MAEVVAQLEEQVASQKRELEYAQLKIQIVEERLRLLRIQKYGPSSEKLSNLQLELLEQEPGVSQEEVVAESERKAPPPVTEKKKRKHPGRQTLPANLPRAERRKRISFFQMARVYLQAWPGAHGAAPGFTSSGTAGGPLSNAM
jgi:transposase